MIRSLKDPFNALLLTAIIFVNVFKLWAINLYPITCDESYYWLWHKRLALSYVDHPPLIAYLNKFISLFGEYNLFNFRLGAIIVALIATYFVYRTGKTLFDRKVGLIAATIFQLVPHYIIVWQTLTIDNLLALFWVISLYCLAKIVKEKNGNYWFLLGGSFGLGLLSKYTMVFFLLPLLVLLIIGKDERKWFKRPEPYLALLLSIFIFSPVIIWNIQHNWLSLTFHADRLQPQAPWQNLLNLLGDQLVHFTPFLFLGLIIYWRQLRQKSQLLFLFSIPLLLIFIGLTALIRLWAHWVIVYQFAAIVGLAAMVADNQKTARRLIVSLWLFSLLLVLVIIFGQPTILPRQIDYKRNHELAARFKLLPAKTYIITPYLGIAGQLDFYAKRNTLMAKDYLKIEIDGFGQRQFDLWGFPDIRRGADVIYYGKPDQATLLKLKKVFRSVKVRSDLKLNLLESYLDELVPYYCRGFKGVVNL